MTTAVVTDSGDVWNRNRFWAACFLVTLLAWLPYFHVLAQPFVSDDYLQIVLGRKYGPVERWGALALDALYRCRATSIVLTYWTELLGGVSPRVFYASSLLLHVVNSLLMLGVGRAFGFGFGVSTAAAGFFAVYLGHQEAVMWYAALPELLLFLFSLLFVLSWLKWLRTPGSAWAYWMGALGAFVLALLSKEPGVMLAPIAVAIAFREKQLRRGLIGVAPMALLAAAYAAAIFINKPVHLHLNDGTFSFSAPFLKTWTNSMGRMLWIWGLASVIWLSATRQWHTRGRIAVLGLIWAGITLLPFCFLTYMPRVPSRHTYLPSAGLALLVGVAFMSFHRRFGYKRWATPALALLLTAHHTGYIWTKKRNQFLERAEPTEQLLALARNGASSVYVHCFPYGEEIAYLALEVMMPDQKVELVWKKQPPAQANAHVVCSRRHALTWETDDGDTKAALP